MSVGAGRGRQDLNCLTQSYGGISYASDICTSVRRCTLAPKLTNLRRDQPEGMLMSEKGNLPNPGVPAPGDTPKPHDFPPGEEPNPERKEPEPSQQPGRPTPSGVPNEIRATDPHYR